LLVVEGGRLVGIITETDVLNVWIQLLMACQ
jgi:CBS domain-containing protein